MKELVFVASPFYPLFFPLFFTHSCSYTTFSGRRHVVRPQRRESLVVCQTYRSEPTHDLSNQREDKRTNERETDESGIREKRYGKGEVIENLVKETARSVRGDVDLEVAREPDLEEEVEKILSSLRPAERWKRKRIEILLKDLKQLKESKDSDTLGEDDEQNMLSLLPERDRAAVKDFYDAEERDLEDVLGGSASLTPELWSRLSAFLSRQGREALDTKSISLSAREIQRKKEKLARRREKLPPSASEQTKQSEASNLDAYFDRAEKALRKRPLCPGCGLFRTYFWRGKVQLCTSCAVNESIIPNKAPGEAIYREGTPQARLVAKAEQAAAGPVAAAARRVAEEFGAQKEATRRELLARQELNSRMDGKENDSVSWTEVPSHSRPSSPNDHYGDEGRKGEGGNGNFRVERGRRRREWSVKASERSLRTINPIRNLVQYIKVKPNPEKALITLSVGDPTVYGNLKVKDSVIEEYVEVIRSGSNNGYSHSMGSLAARSAVAKRYNTSSAPLAADDVVLASGASGALELAFAALVNSGDNLLLPKPGFPLFRTLAEYFGVECRYYSALPDRSWEISLADLNSLADDRTAAIVVNNPSNPCGSVYSRSHLEDLLAVASNLCLPIIADEVYADMSFPGVKFTPLASLSVDVPILTIGAISKQFVVPGWRLGWVLIHDRRNIFSSGRLRRGIQQLTTRMLMPNTPAQAILPALLGRNAKDSGLEDLRKKLDSNAKFMMSKLQGVIGIECVRPQGSMYLMARLDVSRLGLKDDMEFVEKLLEEEAVFVLPGRCFMAENFIRIVFCAPQKTLGEACDRMRSFCARRLSPS